MIEILPEGGRVLSFLLHLPPWAWYIAPGSLMLLFLLTKSLKNWKLAGKGPFILTVIVMALISWIAVL